MSESSDHDYALVVMLNESESTGERLTFTVQKVNQADLDPEQTRVAIIENEGVQTKVALPASLVNPLNELSAEGEDVANAYLQTVVLQSLESVAKANPDGIDSLEAPSSDINIVLKEEETGNNISNRDVVEDKSGTNEASDDVIFEDLSTIQNMLINLKEREAENIPDKDAQDIEPDDDVHKDVASESEISFDNIVSSIQDDIVSDEISANEPHKYPKVYKCGFCNATYTTKYSLNIHVRHHTGEKPFKCTECDAGFIRQSYLKYHMQYHTGVKLYKCNLCEMSYTSGSSLKNHIRTHTGEKPYKCGTCDKTFARKAYLNHHEIIAHYCALPYNCDQCDKVYKTKSSLRMHMKTHNVTNGNHPNKCNICEKTFTRQYDLKRHISSVHEKKNIFKCSLCDMSYTAKGSLVVHMRSHTGEKPFACDKCDAKFARNTYLKIHKISHEDKKPLKCEICSTRFTVMSSLVQHMKRHDGEKPFSCDMCDAKFYRQRSAAEHKRVHTGEKPYKCKLCDKRFSWRCDMRRHSKNHCTEKYTCVECKVNFDNDASLQAHLELHTGNEETEEIQSDKEHVEKEEPKNEPVGQIKEVSNEKLKTTGSNKKRSKSKEKKKSALLPRDNLRSQNK